MKEWESQELWRKLLERRLNELGSMAHGNQKFQADRISDLVEMIDELRQEVAALEERLDKAAEYVKANVPKRNEEGK